MFTVELEDPDYLRQILVLNACASYDRTIETIPIEPLFFFKHVLFFYGDVVHGLRWPMAYDESGRTLQPEESPTVVETWQEMEKLLSEGSVKAIGVSNFSVKTLTQLLAYANVVPAVNQVEMHPSLPQHELLAFCAARGILLTAYSPVGKFKFATDPTITAIADAHSATSAQVLLSWGVQRGTAVIPKTVQPERLKQNVRLLRLTEEEMAVLDTFHKRPGMHRSVCGFHSAALWGSCWGWTYEQLGWQMTTGGVHL